MFEVKKYPFLLFYRVHYFFTLQAFLIYPIVPLFITLKQLIQHTYYNKEHPPSTAGAEISQDPHNQDHHPHDDEDDGRGAEKLVQVVYGAVQLDDLEEVLSILRHQVLLEFHQTPDNEESDAQHL